MKRLTVLFRPWWLVLDAGRMLVRAAVETRRQSFIWPAGMMLRYLVHVLAASPWIGLWVAITVLAGPTRPVLLGGLLGCAGAELVALAARWTRHPIVVGFWTFRRAVAVRKRWPRSWGDYAGRTNQVQAATGQEPSTPVRWRPLVDHPRISWLFWPTGPNRVEFLVGPPPDRTFIHLVEAAPALAAKFSFVESIEVEYDTDRSSLGVLVITFTSGDNTTGTSGRVLHVVPDPDTGDGSWLDDPDSGEATA